MKTPSQKSEAFKSEASHSGSHASAATACDATALPPTGNTGGKLWIHVDPESGESFYLRPKAGKRLEIEMVPIASDGANSYAAITDWLNCTFPFNPKKEPLEQLFQELFSLLGPKFAPAIDRKAKFKFYETHFSLGSSGAALGIGGQAGTVLVSLPGEACSLISDWNAVVTYFRDRRQGRITRWDGAIDDYAGVHTVDYCVELYKSNGFTSGGNKPRGNQIGNWVIPDGRGRSFYIGRRKNGKMLRVYEKGMQLGCPWHPWVRWEVELHNTDRIVPWEVLLEPGKYFAGAYPKALSWAQEEMCRIKTIQKQQTISYEYLLGHASSAYGPLVNVMMQIEKDAQKVVDKLIRPGTPKRLRHPLVDNFREFIASKDGASHE